MNKTIVVTDFHHTPFTRKTTDPVVNDNASFRIKERSEFLASSSGSTLVKDSKRAQKHEQYDTFSLDGTATAYKSDENGNVDSLMVVVADGNGGHRELKKDQDIANVVTQACSSCINLMSSKLALTDPKPVIEKLRGQIKRSSDADTTLAGIKIQKTDQGYVYSAIGIGDSMIVAYNPKTKVVRTLVAGKTNKLFGPPAVLNGNENDFQLANCLPVPKELGEDFLIFGLTDGVTEELEVKTIDKSTVRITIDEQKFAALFSSIPSDAPASAYIAPLNQLAITRSNHLREFMLATLEANKDITEQNRDKRVALLREKVKDKFSAEEQKDPELMDCYICTFIEDSYKIGDDCTIAVARVSPQAFQNAQRLFTDKKNTPFERFSRILPTWLKITLGVLIPPLGLFLLTEPGVAQTRSMTAEWKPWQRWLLAVAGISLIVLCLAAGVAGAIALFTGVGILAALSALAFLKLSLGPAIALTVGGLLGAATSSIWGMQLDPLGVWYDHKGENDYILEPPKPASETLPPPPTGTLAPVNGSAQSEAGKEGAPDTSGHKPLHANSPDKGKRPQEEAHDDEYDASPTVPLLPAAEQPK